MKDYEMKVIRPFDRLYYPQCVSIAKECRKEINGKVGLPRSSCIVCATRGAKVLGYISMLDDRNLSGNFYVIHILVRPEERCKGIATNMLKFVLHHSQGYDKVTSDVSSFNIPSTKLHKKLGFQKLAYSSKSKTYHLGIDVDEIENNSHMTIIEDEEKDIF